MATPPTCIKSHNRNSRECKVKKLVLVFAINGLNDIFPIKSRADKEKTKMDLGTFFVTQFSY